MSGQLVCVKCGRILKIDKNGVVAMELMDDGIEPYRIFMFDRWKCPECGVEMLKGQGQAAYVYNPDWNRLHELVTIKYL